MVIAWNRRDFLKTAGQVALAFGLAPGALAAVAAPDPATRALLREVAQLVIPATDTPGAGDVGAGDFVALALAHGLADAHRPLSGALRAELAPFVDAAGVLDHPRWLAAALDAAAGGSFMGAGVDRAGLLARVDAAAFAGPADHPWRRIKTLILTGYYTSEAGGSQELRYELIPGRWDPDLPATGDTRALSSDWTAVDFG